MWRPLVPLLVLSLSASAYGDPAADGERLRKSGRYAEAQQLLEPVVRRDPRAFAARRQLGLVYRATGQRDLERAVWNRFYDDYEANALDRKSARDLTYVAEAARYLGGWQDASDTFRDAVDADPNGADGARANIAWAALFLEKYDAGHAEVSLKEALKVLPRDAEAHALMARVKLEQNDIAGVDKELALALAPAPNGDPKNATALDLRAEKLVDDERWPEAVAAAQKVLAVNPEELRARTLVAAVRYLRDDTRGYTAERERVLKVNPRAWEFFHGIAEFLVKEHRYDEANQMEAEALKLEPKSWVALAAIGTNWLRLGDDAKGLESLREAWKRDPFNVRTYNLLNLYDDVIAKQYVTVEGTPFRFRVSKKEQLPLLHYVTPMVAREYKELVARYGFTPAGPLTIELFGDSEHFSVRTVGLPGIEPLGVTFGKVVTALSPLKANFNWGMMLWHEVAHVFSIQMSRGRVPRWFTEGLSEYETARVDPTWTRRTHAELWRALSDGKLLPVADLNAGFTRARDVSHMVVTYHQAAEEVMFLVRRWGFGVVPKALTLFAQGQDSAQVIPAITGLDVKAYDAAFVADLRGRLKAYEGEFFVRPSDFSDVEALRDRLAAHPDDARTKGLMALALVTAGQADAAQKLIDSLPELAAKPRETMTEKPRELALAAAQLALARKDRPMAHMMLDALVQLGHGDGYDARYLMGRLATDEGNLEEAKKQLALAKQFDPDAAEPYVMLGKALLKTDEPAALREWETAAQLDVMDPAIPKALVEHYDKLGRWADVLRAATLAQNIAPYDVDVHLARARALQQLGRGGEARAEIDLGLACAPNETQEAALRALGTKAAAPPRSAPR
jgi:tetratricopeptide (TPR) repeat protein